MREVKKKKKKMVTKFLPCLCQGRYYEGLANYISFLDVTLIAPGPQWHTFNMTWVYYRC